jgi:filamentous hemagglutinin family protein
MKTPLLFLLLIISLSTPAQITTDGTLGPTQNLSGDHYQIGPNLGQQHGNNLFHSFRDFNLQSWESATFSGPNHIQNVISRVTGGNPSHIDGLFRSTIPGANVYFLNPYGIMFGPNVQLDVQGSFHASTADYLRLGDGGRFEARNPSDSILTVAPIESFGFLDNTSASISVSGHGQITQTEWEGQLMGLRIREGKMLSLIGGSIDINHGSFFETVTVDEFGNEMIQITRLPSLLVPSGQINLASVASPGEVRLGEGFMDVSSLIQFDDISIKNKSVIAVNGEGHGRVFIRGKQVMINNSAIEAKTLGHKNGSLVDIQVEKLLVSHNSQIDARTEGKGTNILVRILATDSVSFYDGSNININTYDKVEGAGDAGIVLIEAPNISFIEDSGISNSTVGKGNAGEVMIRASEQFSIKNSNIYISPFSASTGGHGGKLLIEAKDVLVTEGSYLSGTTFGPGNGGQITILANGKVTLSEANTNGLVSGIFANSNPSQAVANDAGNIILEANTLVIEKGAMISSSTISKPGRISGQGGHITLRVHGIIKINGVNPYGENSEGFGSGIYVRAKGNNTGAAGNINIEAQALSLTDGAVIASTTDSTAPGGQINIQIEGMVSITGNSASFVLREPASSQRNFKIDFPESQGSLSISGIYGSSESAINNAGMAGNIILNANAIFMKNGFINTETQNAGGGNLTINILDLLYLQDSKITTSVNGGSGDGGNITIYHPQFTVLNKGQLKAQANAGQGGNIRIVAEQFIKSYESLISASSRLGLDGNVQIDSPAVDLDAMLVVLPGGRVEAQLKTCNIPEELDNPTYSLRVKKRDRSYPLMK